MSSRFNALEQRLFRSVNSIVEPAVRKGIGSPRFAPASLIVLQTTGFKSGQQRRTPLWSLRFGPYRLVGTARGERSFWVKNLRQQSRVSYFVGGKERLSDALVLTHVDQTEDLSAYTPFLSLLIRVVNRYSRDGWDFAILLPQAR